MRSARIARWVALSAVLAVVMVACGDDTTTTTAASEPQTVACAPDQIDSTTLNFYNWSDYIDTDLYTKFKDQYGVDVIESNYDSNETLIAQLEAGVAYDLIVPSDYMVKIMIDEGLLYKLDKTALTNYGNLDEKFRTQPYDPNGDYSVAYQYGTTGLGVNLELVGDYYTPSWALVFDPNLTQHFAGGVSVLNDPRETMGAALEYLGYSLNDTNRDHLDEAIQLIKDAKQYISVFDSDEYETNLANGVVAVAQGYSGNMINAIASADNPDNFKYILPEEGATLWIDNMAIPTISQAPCTAHTFINFLLDAENGAQLTNYNYYGSPNAASVPYIDQEVIDFYADTATAKTTVIVYTGVDYELNFSDALAEAKS